MLVSIPYFELVFTEKQVTELNHKLKQQSQQKAMELVEAEEQWMAQQRNMADQQHSRLELFNPFNPEISIVIFIPYKPRIAVTILGL